MKVHSFWVVLVALCLSVCRPRRTCSRGTVAAGHSYLVHWRQLGWRRGPGHDRLGPGRSGFSGLTMQYVNLGTNDYERIGTVNVTGAAGP